MLASHHGIWCFPKNHIPCQQLGVFSLWHHKVCEVCPNVPPQTSRKIHDKNENVIYMYVLSVRSAPKAVMSSKPPCLGGHSQKLLQINIMPGCNVPLKWKPIKTGDILRPTPNFANIQKNKRGATSTSFHKLQSSDLNWETQFGSPRFFGNCPKDTTWGKFPTFAY